MHRSGGLRGQRTRPDPNKIDGSLVRNGADTWRARRCRSFAVANVSISRRKGAAVDRVGGNIVNADCRCALANREGLGASRRCGKVCRGRSICHQRACTCSHKVNNATGNCASVRCERRHRSHSVTVINKCRAETTSDHCGTGNVADANCWRRSGNRKRLRASVDRRVVGPSRRVCDQRTRPSTDEIDDGTGDGAGARRARCHRLRTVTCVGICRGEASAEHCAARKTPRDCRSYRCRLKSTPGRRPAVSPDDLCAAQEDCPWTPRSRAYQA